MEEAQVAEIQKKAVVSCSDNTTKTIVCQWWQRYRQLLGRADILQATSRQHPKLGVARSRHLAGNERRKQPSAGQAISCARGVSERSIGQRAISISKKTSAVNGVESASVFFDILPATPLALGSRREHRSISILGDITNLGYNCEEVLKLAGTHVLHGMLSIAGDHIDSNLVGPAIDSPLIDSMDHFISLGWISHLVEFFSLGPQEPGTVCADVAFDQMVQDSVEEIYSGTLGLTEVSRDDATFHGLLKRSNEVRPVWPHIFGVVRHM